jgi:prevent-host-death family protein
MKSVSITELRANLLKYLKLVSRGEQISVTSKGKVLATLVPPVSEQRAAREDLDRLARTAVIGDLVSPLGEDWSANR